MHDRDHAPFNPWLHRFSTSVVGATFVLIFIGGLVTTTGSGLAVPDWPTTYGHFMFSFPLSQMVGGILYEHGHRMVASIVGMLMIVLMVWIWLKDSRRWLKWLASAALLAVVLQGVLGGLTVLFLLPTPISVLHACLAQGFFCMTVALAVFTSRGWLEAASTKPDVGRPALSTLAVWTTAVVYGQLILGALMRHMGAGLAIPDFPLAFGRIIPPIDSQAVAVHFLHRVGALIVVISVLWTAWQTVRHYKDEPRLLRPALALVAATVLQIGLAAWTIWSQKAVLPTTAHVAMGAFLLGTSLLLALRAHRLLEVAEPAAERSSLASQPT